jgi:hypothetical protein
MRSTILCYNIYNAVGVRSLNWPVGVIHAIWIFHEARPLSHEAGDSHRTHPSSCYLINANESAIVPSS